METRIKIITGNPTYIQFDAHIIFESLFSINLKNLYMYINDFKYEVKQNNVNLQELGYSLTVVEKIRSKVINQVARQKILDLAEDK